MKVKPYKLRTKHSDELSRNHAWHSRSIKPRLIIGLGNPGKKYEQTYHNVGFLAIDFFANSKLLTTDYHLLKSNAYMNQSGSFVKKILKKYKIKPKELLVVHDDFDIELGKYKISFGRGSAGHHGAESIIKSLNTKNFWRLRIGIGHGPTQASRGSRRKKAIEVVLKKINKQDLEILKKVFGEIEILYLKKFYNSENNTFKAP